MSTLKDIAKEVGISVSAVSLAIRDHRTISIETKQRVWQAQDKLGYKMHLRPQKGPGAPAVATGGPAIRNIAFLLIDRQFDNPIYGLSFQCIADAAAARHWRPMYVSATLKDLEAGRIPPLLRNGGVDGIIISGVYGREAHVQMCKLGIPLAIRGCYDLGCDPWMACESDLPYGTRLMINRLAELGHTRFGLILRNADTEFGFQIQQSYLQELSLKKLVNAGIEFELEKPEGARLAARALLKSRPTAILLGADAFAVEVYAACEEAGLKIPEEISIIAFRGGSRPPVQPSLVSVGARGVDLGIVEKLGRLMENPDTICTRELYPMELVPGGSIGKAPNQ